MDGVWKRRWLTNDGELVRRFEERLRAQTGTKHCIAVANATLGLQLAIMASGMHGRVITPAFSFVATAHALELCGLEPILCDVDRRTHNLDPVRARELAEQGCGGILPVHLWGRPCDTRALDKLARDFDIPLVYDAAHAFACSKGGKPIGGFGDAEVFSFHATKFLNTAEGGAITTNDDEVAHRLRLLRNFGFAGYDNVVSIGTNAKMSELHAALGLTNLDALGRFVRRNQANQRLYNRLLAKVPGVELLQYDPRNRQNQQYVVAEIHQDRFGRSRDELARELWKEGILARRYFAPGIHRMQPYAGRQHSLLTHTEDLAQTLLALPNGMAVAAADVRRVCTSIKHLARA